MRLHRQPGSDLAHAILMHTTAGLFDGDRVDCAIDVEAGARVAITQQAATKVHPSAGDGAAQSIRVRVASGGELHLHLKPIILFAHARLTQRTAIELERGARVSYWETLMAGRIGRGEAWRFTRFRAETTLSLDSRPIFLDRVDLNPGRKPASPWGAGGCDYVSTGLCLVDEAKSGPLMEDLHHDMPDAGVDSPVAGLVIVRAPCSSGIERRRLQDLFARRTLA
jgi:urease accessory protein